MLSWPSTRQVLSSPTAAVLNDSAYETTRSRGRELAAAAKESSSFARGASRQALFLLGRAICSRTVGGGGGVGLFLLLAAVVVVPPVVILLLT